MTIATVRLLAADPETYDRAAEVADGLTADFRVPNSPVVAGSQQVLVAGVPKTEGVEYTFDDAQGVASFVPGQLPTAAQEVTIAYRHTLLSDASLQALIDLEGDDRLAAAQALDIIASSEALITKKIKLLDLQTDGPAVAKALRDHAAALRKQAADAIAILAGDDGGFDVAELVVDDFSFRERILAEALRE